MRSLILAAALAAEPALAATAMPVTYDMPEETLELAPGPGREAAAVCAACHSVDYIATQPRGLRDPAAFWTAEVAKMRHSYGAPIEAADMPAIVDYLVAAYGQ